MKILNVSLDPESGNPDSKVSGRFKDYGNLVEKYDILTLGSGSKIYDLAPNVTVTVLKRKNKLSDFLRISTVAFRLLRKKKYDLVTIADPYFMGLKMLKIARLRGVAIEIQVHGFEKLRGIRKMVAKFVLRHADSVRVVSERLKKQLVGEFGVREEKITAVPIFVPTASHARVKQNNEFTFLMVSRLVPVKNISFSIKAFKKVTERHDTELHIVGGGSESENLESLVKELKLEEKVKFLGKQTNVGSFYEKADAFLLTSEKEGWPLVIMEALSYGLPIIMTPVGQVGEILFDNINVLVVSQGDEQLLANSMVRMIEDNNLTQKLSSRAKETIEKLPSKEEILKKYLLSWEKAVKCQYANLCE